MAKFEYNWATAEIVKLYLRNSRAQMWRKERNAGGSPPLNPGSPGIGPGTGANIGSIGATTGVEHNSDSSSDDDSDED